MKTSIGLHGNEFLTPKYYWLQEVSFSLIIFAANVREVMQRERKIPHVRNPIGGRLILGGCRAVPPLGLSTYFQRRSQLLPR